MNSKTFFILMISVISISCFSQKEDKEIDSKKWREAIGEISGSPRHRFITYKANYDKYYKVRFYRVPFGQLYNDEKYKLKYDPANPEKADICYACPVFLPDEKTIIIPGKVTKIFSGWPISRIYTIRYEYGLDYVSYRREQELPSNYKELYPNLDEDHAFEVECWAENPQRGIIHLDKPWRKS